MPALVTPARRRREDLDHDNEASHDAASDSGDSGQESGRASKRARSESVAPLSPRHDDDEDDETTIGTTFGLSDLAAAVTNGNNPSAMRNTGGRPTQSDSTHGSARKAHREHQPGSIVRVKLSNFVTYKAVEFFPGPSLNMVIGPNGTGKSTLVCAICIGLGWDPKYLGRQKEVSEFVKHGEAEGFIEVELRRKENQSRNTIIKCHVKRDANKTIYTVNDRASNKKQVQELARSFSIQIDNLCQFLPQDKVVEFAAMSPVDLLQSTQQAVGTKQMIRWHQQLSGLRQNQRKVETEVTSGQETLTNLEARQKAQEPDVARVREREQVKRSVDLWKKTRPFVKYQDIYRRKKEQEQTLKEAQKDLAELQESLEPTLRAVNAKAAYRDAIEVAKVARVAAVEAADGECTANASKADRLEKQLADIEAQTERTRKELRDDRVEITRLQEGLKAIETQLRNEPPPVDLSALNEQIRSKERRVIEIREDDGPAARREFDKIKLEAGETMDKITKRKQDMQGLDSRAGKQESKLQRLSPHTYKAWRHIRDHQDQFDKPIFGPPMVECSVKDPRYVPLMEVLFQRGDFMYLVAQTRADFLRLHRLVKEELKLAEVNIRTAANGLERFPRPSISPADMARWGFEGWALDFMEGPEPVLAALCETTNLHRTAVALQDTTQAQFDDIVKGSIQAWVTSKSYYRITRRREYGSDAQSTTVKEVRPPQIWTDQPVDPEAKAEMERETRALNEEYEQFKAKAKEIQAQLNALKSESEDLHSEIDALKREKDENQKLQSTFRALPTRLANQKSKIEDRERRRDERREGYKAQIRQHEELFIERAQATLDFTKISETLLNAHEGLEEAEMMLVEAKSDHNTLIERNQAVKNTLDERRAEVSRLQAEQKRLSDTYKRERVATKAFVQSLTEEEREFVGAHGKTTLEELDAEIESEEARLELMHGGSGRVLQEFEERGRRIEGLQKRLEEFSAALSEINTNIVRIRGRWEPRLDALVQRISDAFAFNMRQIHCAGEVAIHKDADFDQWAIQIRVKFREHESLTQLDAHRQSGGERAVSTVFYLMSLQALTRSPFRVVDEINQGMDPRNERLVHGRMVAIATGNDEWEEYYRANLAGSASWSGAQGTSRADDAEDDSNSDDNDEDEDDAAALQETDDIPPEQSLGSTAGGSQYFLITPKLLHGLRYDEGMTVLCIASGEHLQSAQAVDFRSTLALRRRQAGAVSA